MALAKAWRASATLRLIVVSTADMPAEAMFATLCCAALTTFAGSPETIAVPTASMPAAVVVATVNPANAVPSAVPHA